MTTTRKGVANCAAWLFIILAGSATSILADVDFRHVGSGGAGDRLSVTVAYRPAIARPIEATVTESPVQLRAERQGATGVDAAKVTPVVVRDPPFVAIEPVGGRSTPKPLFLAPRHVETVATLMPAREVPRLASSAVRRGLPSASVLRELRQLRAENLLLRRVVTDLSRRP